MIHIATNRADTESEKWGKYRNQDVLPMWVADSEFLAAEVIQEALKKRLQHGVFGYPEATKRFKDAVVRHCRERYGWDIEADWVSSVPGVVPGLNLARAISIDRGKKHGLSFDPVYPHLRRWSPMLDFQQTAVSFEEDGEGWRWSPEALQQARRPETGLLLLCHPHNPLGRVYPETELQQLADFAQEADLIVCSDEIHCDLILDGGRHRPFASLSEDAAQRSITLMATSKTYNIAGLCFAFAIIPNADLRARWQRLRTGLVGECNLLGQIATIAALEEGESWRQAHLAYLRENARLVYERINATGVLKMKMPEATFLAWMDARGTELAEPQAYFESHGVGLSSGADFGAPHYVRLNFGCGRELLEEALQRLEFACKALKTG